MLKKQLIISKNIYFKNYVKKGFLYIDEVKRNLDRFYNAKM